MLRFELVRLYQALAQIKREGLPKSRLELPGPLSGSLHGGYYSSLLRAIEENRRERARIWERLPVQYTQNLNRFQRRPPVSSKRLDEGLLDWLLEVTQERTTDVPKAWGLRLRIHLEESKMGLVYFAGVLASGAPESYGSALRRMDLSSSGICLPTERRHEKGDDFALVLYLPIDRNPLLRLRGEVVRQSQANQSGGYQTAVRFSDMSEEDEGRILDFILARRSQKLIEKAYRARS